jgi:hypothetical protein
MVPLQFTNYPLAGDAIISIPVKEHLPGPTIVLVRRSGLSLTPAAQYFVDLPQPPSAWINKSKTGLAADIRFHFISFL